MSAVPIPEDDPAMASAIAEAQRSLPTFFEQYLNPSEGQQYFLLKVRFERQGEFEHIWIADFDPSVMPLTGTVANEPTLPGLSFMSSASFYPEQITDWMIVENGYMVGGYTNHVLIKHMSPHLRAEYLAGLPYKVRGYDQGAA